MARKKTRQSVAISDKCFRLLRLAHEIQSDVKVLKAVVDEVDVLRLCRSLGMAVSSESNSMHEFEFGMFDASDYDADFARYIREKLAGGGSCSAQQEEDAEGEELLEIGCLFGKQLEVKAELARLGFWGSECEDGLQPEDQGVYCIERGDGGGGRRQFVVFAWLDAGLFKPEAVRDTPAYVLRFLITLSSSITCCLSELDFERIKAEVDAVSDTSSSRWKSCSVSFRVQKQLEQSDNISCGQVSTLAIPKSDRVKSVWFVGGVFPAIAVESAAPSTTEWVEQEAIVPRAEFPEWFMKKHEEFAIQLPSGQLRPSSMRDYLLQSFDQFPYQELRDLRSKFEEHSEEAKRRIDREAFEWAKKIFDDGVHGASMLFAVRSPENSSHLDAVLRRYQAFLQQLENCEVLRGMDYCEYKMLYLPDRIQAQMKVLSTVFQRDPLAFDEVLNKVVMQEPIDPVNSSNRVVAAVRWLFGINDDAFSSAFRLAMTKHQPGLQRIWMNEVNRIVSMMQAARSTQRFQQSSYDRGWQFGQEEETAKQKAFGHFRDYLKSGNGHLGVTINRMILSSDETSVSIHWMEEVEKEPTKVIRLYQLKGEEAGKISLVGTVEVEPGLEIREVATVKMDQAIAVLVKENSTIVRRAQFPLQPHFLKLAAEQFEVRSFPRACSLCAVRVIDRRVAFLFGDRAGRLGDVAFCRFNEAFTSVELTHSIDMDASFGLAGPLVDILLTERSLCAVDGKGDLQSFDIRTRRTSKKVSCEDKGDDKSTWVGGLLSFADELVVGRARIDSNQRLCLSSISSEDHRALPTAVVGAGLKSKDFAVGANDDVLYVVDPHEGAVYSSQLSVTVRSDAYRIERSGNAAKNTRQGRLQADKSSKGAAAHWLRVFYHVFEKFPVRSLVDMSMNPDAPFSLELQVVVADGEAMNDGRDVCVEYFNSLMVDLKRLNKPLSGLNLSKKLKCVSSEETEGQAALQVKSVRRALISIVSFVPVQICRAEDNMLKLLQDGEDSRSTAKGASTTSSEDESGENGADASEIAQSIRFGLLSPLLESWNGRCVVVTSMGKQSTGKSYFLNHLAGTSFAISGSRCTDGAWMSLRFVSANVLLVVLDFEGLGSFERSEQEDIFLSVLNASVSLFTVFRMESRFDKDIDGLFSRFQKGVQLIKNDPRLFRGLLYMSVKDVNINDRQGVVDELVAKLDTIFESNKDQNFLTEMYAGQLEINCSPPFGTMDYYHCMENDAARTLCEIVSPSDRAPPGFVTGKSFLDCLRIVLAKISILDWTSMDKSTQNLLVADVKQKLPGILRTGCLVSLPLVGDKTIPLHLKEDVLLTGTRKKLVISMKELCEANPGFASKWTTLNGSMLLDSIADEAIDLGFDVTTVAAKKVVTVQKTIDMLFQYFLTLLGKTYGSSRLTAEDQSGFDAFVAFVLLRRKLKVERWLRGMLGEHLSEVRAQLEQRYAHPLPVYLSRCQHKCAQCQLGCMHSVTHSPAIDHSCCTDHKCLGRCEYGECCADPDLIQTPPCSRSAGHEGKCECEKGAHTCGQTCVLAHASNCDKACSKRAEHTGDHRCSVQVHVCGAKCSADTCNATCLLDIQRPHSVHKCAEVQCLHTCLMDGCKNTCAQKDHFHGQGAASRAFAEESGVITVGDSSEGVENDASVAHMCSGSHACPETCQIDGICEQKVHLKKSARTYTGARGSFEYIYQEMNGCKKHCAHVLASGEKDHEGSDHSCLDQAEGNDETTVHYCDVRCPSCSYYCNKHFGHMGLHATSHGNMRQTYFMAKTKDIDVEDRKYQVGERGIAEMCNLFCSKMGRGHTHYLSCESKDGEKCVYTADASEDHRRHCVDELFPPPGRDMDELLHAQFWSTIGWEDPCNEEERAEFAKCRFQCNAPEHDGDDAAASFCVLDAWHKPELKPEGADDGFSYVDGHKFECVHAVDTGKFHNIFVLDSSGSMSGQPWTDLLCACNEFGTSRLKDGGEEDLVSYVTFDHESRIICEGELLPDALTRTVPFTGGGTSFGEGLRAANEVLSRNDFEEFKAVLIFFSDGQPCDISMGITLAQHIHSTYAKYDLKAFAVGFGRVNLSVLQRVAAEMGGEYRQVLDANALRTEFQRIAAVLCNSEASLALAESDTEAS